MAVAWTLRHKVVTSSLIGASKVAHVEEAVGGARQPRRSRRASSRRSRQRSSSAVWRRRRKSIPASATPNNPSVPGSGTGCRRDRRAVTEIDAAAVPTYSRSRALHPSTAYRRWSPGRETCSTVSYIGRRHDRASGRRPRLEVVEVELEQPVKSGPKDRSSSARRDEDTRLHVVEGAGGPRRSHRAACPLVTPDSAKSSCRYEACRLAVRSCRRRRKSMTVY